MKAKKVKAWAVYGRKYSIGKILSISLEKPKDLCHGSEYPYVEVEIRPVLSRPKDAHKPTKKRGK